MLRSSILIAALALACSARPAQLATCNVGQPVQFSTNRRFPLQQSSSDTADFQLVIRGSNLRDGMAHICVVTQTDVVFHDSVATGLWGPPVPEANLDSIVRGYAPKFFEVGLRVFPAHPVPWGQGNPDPYGEWTSDDPYSALIRGLKREGLASPVDTTQIINAIAEFSTNGSAILTFQIDPEGFATIVWWPSKKRFVQLVM